MLHGQLHEADLLDMFTRVGWVATVYFSKGCCTAIIDNLNSLIDCSNIRNIIRYVERGGNFLSFISRGSAEEVRVRSKLIRFDVIDDGYEQARIIFGSSYIRDKLIISAITGDYSSPLYIH